MTNADNRIFLVPQHGVTVFLRDGMAPLDVMALCVERQVQEIIAAVERGEVVAVKNLADPGYTLHCKSNF